MRGIEMATSKRLSPFEEARQAFLTPDGEPLGVVDGRYALEVINKLERRIKSRNDLIIMQRASR
ncbi:hypothetical protein [Leuconostoc mesenteroides]|uniref:hypothetical protein n=2 Tax=Leuconostoc mesenteroides TaxID=1245 RepID=UPI00235F6952|nr:hypothetical protein [Leuconostoc mesenteroides]